MEEEIEPHLQSDSGETDSDDDEKNVEQQFHFVFVLFSKFSLFSEPVMQALLF